MSQAVQLAKINIYGAVQGVGFRPFIYRLAQQYNLKGCVSNTSQGVSILVEGSVETLREFITAVRLKKPERAVIFSMNYYFVQPAGYKDFEIITSESEGVKSAWILPDIATCHLCIEEIFDPTDRRYLYPFTNCTHCGPRYTIVESLPYDRPNTTMKKFVMCPACRVEYENPNNRRFHAQPNACPECGPVLQFYNSVGSLKQDRHNALLAAVSAIRKGHIVAVKGLGGFHLFVDAGNRDAVARLRARKNREQKPFALLFPDIRCVESVCTISNVERQWLISPEAPIVLLHRRHGKSSNDATICSEVAPFNPWLGVMLPYTPLHHIMLRLLDKPVVATSANLSDEPICYQNENTLERMKGIADCYLMHNRPIARHVDDSILRVVKNRELVLRRARGFAPLPVATDVKLTPSLAVGGHLKNTVCLAQDKFVFISQHIGDLETESSMAVFKNVTDDLIRLYQINPQSIFTDLHPDYESTKYAQRMYTGSFGVQHHYAHILSCMAENEIAPPVLGIAWDGTGYGPDGTVWGGEFLEINANGYRRIGHLLPFLLPGGEKAVKEPRRSAAGVLYRIFGRDCADTAEFQKLFPQKQAGVILKMLQRRINSPVTTSAGRLFDAVSALSGIQTINYYEGQAAMRMEYLAESSESDNTSYDFNIGENNLIVDWKYMIQQILEDVRSNDLHYVSKRFHETMSAIIVRVAERVGVEKVVMSGGCFQNRLLLERTITLLEKAGFMPVWHQRVPPNDGGICLGQIMAPVYGGIK
ncbi:carbamoyltransferase HypF [candidate division KSB1 bacterium]|nr:carbamoyltransferase HypF [candidate division KSB1 bacterium]